MKEDARRPYVAKPSADAEPADMTDHWPGPPGAGTQEALDAALLEGLESGVSDETPEQLSKRLNALIRDAAR